MKFSKGQLDTEWLHQLDAINKKPTLLSELTDSQLDNLLILLEIEEQARWLDSSETKVKHTNNVVRLFK